MECEEGGKTRKAINIVWESVLMCFAVFCWFCFGNDDPDEPSDYQWPPADK
jgi:hypothetical protein